MYAYMQILSGTTNVLCNTRLGTAVMSIGSLAKYLSLVDNFYSHGKYVVGIFPALICSYHITLFIGATVTSLACYCMRAA